MMLDHYEHVPLTRQVHRDPDGQPLKTALANRFPLLSRRERRALMRVALKVHKKAQRSGAEGLNGK